MVLVMTYLTDYHQTGWRIAGANDGQNIGMRENAELGELLIKVTRNA